GRSSIVNVFIGSRMFLGRTRRVVGAAEDGYAGRPRHGVCPMQIEDLATLAPYPATAILPDHPAYDEHRLSFNGALDRRPAVIVPCTSTEEVVAAVRAARSAGLSIAVRGGAHSVAGHGFADGALVVSLAAMREIRIEPDARIGHAGGGAQWN